MRYTDQRGFVMYSILMIFITLSSIINSVMLATIRERQQQRLSISRKYHDGMLHYNESKLIERISWQKSICTIPIIDANTLASYSRDWWQLHACEWQRDDAKLYYVIESLGVDSCAHLTETTVAEYVRVTVRVEDNNDDSYSLTQMVFAMPALYTGECQDHIRSISLGLQSERVL